MRMLAELPAPPCAGWFDPVPPAPGRTAVGRDPVRVHLVLTWKGRLLFVRRADSGLWGFPSGDLRAGESAVDGACRVGADQVMVGVARPAAQLVHVHRAGAVPRAGVGLFVRASRFRGVPVVADRREVDRLAWSAPAAAPTPCGPGVAEAAAACGWPCVADSAGHAPNDPIPERGRCRSGRVPPETAEIR